jgi:hypothetical protein
MHTRLSLLVLISKELRNELEVQQIFFACLFRLTKICLYHVFDKSEVNQGTCLHHLVVSLHLKYLSYFTQTI